MYLKYVRKQVILLLIVVFYMENNSLIWKALR